jgi:hypothetical protein
VGVEWVFYFLNVPVPLYGESTVELVMMVTTVMIMMTISDADGRCTDVGDRF